eukprot:TRINITY_DN9085_c0_g1_i4.p1 TRINITY_DN9085_c0_g1~~TRINITY_DN9085_c0_g1_i4.p1  ORF type:complete len:539 (+),score=110.57 TRINITY_DN9085_c0_g1_i4:525-2141(+)
MIKTSSVDPTAHNCHALFIACQEGLEELVKFYLRQKSPKYDVEGENPLVPAAENNHVGVVKLLLQDSRINPARDQSFALQVATQAGNTKIAKILLSYPSVNPGEYDDNVVKMAAQNGHVEIVKLLLAHQNVNPASENNFALQMACEDGHTEVVKLLLSDPRVKPHDSENRFLKFACQHGHTDVVKLLLKYQTPNDIRVHHCLAFRIACYRGYFDIVKLLLDSGHIIVDDAENDAIISACDGGHYEITKLLLSYPGVDPATNGNICIKLAAGSGNLELVKLLLSYPSVDPVPGDALGRSCNSGHLEIVQELLKQPFHFSLDEALLEAIRGGREDVLELLFIDERLHLKDDLIKLFTKSIREGHVNIVKNLLSEDLILSCEEADKLFLHATEHLTLVSVLLDDTRFNPSNDTCHKVLHTAIVQNHTQLATLLIQHKKISLPSWTNYIMCAAKRGNCQIISTFFQERGKKISTDDLILSIIYVPDSKKKLIYLSWLTWPIFCELLLGLLDEGSSLSSLLYELRVHFSLAIVRAYSNLLITF